MIKLSKTYWPIIILVLVNIALFLTNYKPGTYLTGWDNLHSEFWPEMNIQRSIFAVWQEYQSLGLLGGMGHASDLVRQLYILFLTFVLPNNLIRYVSTFTMLFLGGLGAYFLTKNTLSRGVTRLGNPHRAPTASLSKRGLSDGSEERQDPERLLAFMSALFYTLNIGTIQAFYAPYEAFSFHFAFLPWILLSSAVFLKNPSFKNLVFVSLVILLGTPSAYVPTLYTVVVFAVGIYSLVQFLLSENRKKFLRHLAVLASLFIIINSFWAFPFAYSTFTKSSVNLNSKINQMATQTIIEQNKEFGTFTDTALLRGFWFNNVDPDINGNFTFMFTPWRNHFSNKNVVIAGFVLFGIILIGTIGTLRGVTRLGDPRRAPAGSIADRGLSGGGEKRQDPEQVKTGIVFVVLFLFAFTMLATDAFPLSFINELFRKIPLFDQAFRFPFTKFSILAALSYSIMLSFGLIFLFEIIKKLKIDWKLEIGNWKFKILPAILYSLITILLFYISLPAFNGNLFYSKERTSIPKEYFDVFDFFKKQDPATRIANLPQPTFWGWQFYKWPASPGASLGGPDPRALSGAGGYGGSGFLWYGIKQPILDRAFDTWSKESENYYFELSSAIYAKDSNRVEKILNKYQISWILLDKNQIYPQSPKSLFYDEIESILSNISSIEKTAVFGKISIYKANLLDRPKSFVYTTGELPRISSPEFTTEDTAYATHGNYISNPSSYSPVASPYIFPFGSLFSQKLLKEPSFAMNLSDYITISTKINAPQDSILSIPLFLQKEKGIPFEINKTSDDNGASVLAVSLRTPIILIDGNKVWGETLELPLFIIPKDAPYPITLNINGISQFKIDSNTSRVGTGFLTSMEDNFIVLSGSDFSKTQGIPSIIFDNLFANTKQEVSLSQGDHEISVLIPKINDSSVSFEPDLSSISFKKCDNFRKGQIKTNIFADLVSFEARNSSICASFYAPGLLHDQGYAVYIESKNNSGRPMHFWVLNQDEQSSPIDTYLSSNFFVLPPMEKNGRGYSFHFDTISIGRDPSINEFNYIKVYPIPFDFIKTLSIKPKEFFQNIFPGGKLESVYHPNESLYLVTVSKTTSPTTITLSQAYDPGWKAYSVQSSKFKVKSFLNSALPFVFGREIKEHVKVNGWSNAWILPGDKRQATSDKQIVIVYLPQYLEYIGGACLIALLVYLLFQKTRKTQTVSMSVNQ